MALPEGGPYVFPVEVPPGLGLGVQLKKRRREPAGYEITEILTAGDHFVLGWNARSAQTFPDDVLRVGDIIIQANAATTHTEIRELGTKRNSSL